MSTPRREAWAMVLGEGGESFGKACCPGLETDQGYAAVDVLFCTTACEVLVAGQDCFPASLLIPTSCDVGFPMQISIPSVRSHASLCDSESHF